MSLIITLLIRVLIRASVADGPLEDLQVSATGCHHARPDVPLASLPPRPLQDLQVSVTCRPRARPPVPRTGPPAQPLEDAELTARSSGLARQFIEDAPPLHPVRPPAPRSYHRS
eukprot:CAMPEP_0194268248 /NCGR_PEP_ID=MMETSP0169-20130528/2614_1 /TAXON_ID=218684 /ORGANISM="Corethron pennatum, Strain L29A3" /LENGTH=113 /DNA_ID=CAMNT_0039009413 /DNA_START=69 /DNA_END=407 /DNA_ORIENTATION=-